MVCAPSKDSDRLGICIVRPGWSKSSLSAWRKLGYYSEDSDQNVSLVLSWGGSYVNKAADQLAHPQSDDCLCIHCLDSIVFIHVRRQENLVLIAYASSEGSGEPAQSRQNLCCSLIQAVSQEERSDRKPDPWPFWMAGHAQLQFVMTERSKTQIRLTGPTCSCSNISRSPSSVGEKEVWNYLAATPGRQEYWQEYWLFQGGTSVVILYCYLFLLSNIYTLVRLLCEWHILVKFR